MKKKTRKILDIILWILGIIAIGFLIWGILRILL
jgi:TRAP-type C4-dicarboxylate transport system permease small subunit